MPTRAGGFPLDHPAPSRDMDFLGRLCAALRANADDVVVIDGGGAHTGSEFMAHILWASSWLGESLGVGAGSLVAVTSANTARGLALRYGAHLLGAAACHLPFVGADRQRAMLDLINPTVTVSDGTGPMVETASSWGVRAMPAPTTPLPTPNSEEFAAIRRYRNDDVCLLIASGGTTGIPKASYRTAARYTAMLDVAGDPTRRQLVVTPLAYIAATLVDEALVGSGSVVLGEHSWRVDRVIDVVEAEAPTHMFVVEPALADLVAAAADPRTRRRLRPLRQVFHLGASAPLGLRRRAHERLGQMVVHGYAASELGPVTSTAGHPFNAAAAGFVVGPVQCRIVDASGADVPPGEAGTILVKSPWTANGYWNTGPLHDFEEWFDTKDSGRLTAEGELTVIGRDGDFLGATGVHVSQLEAAASLAAEVEYVVVLPDRERPDAATVVVQSSDPGASRAVKHALAPFRDRVEAKVVVLDRIPRTEQGKPDRLDLGRRAVD